MSWYSLDLLYDITVAATISIEAESVEEACRLAIEQADAIDAWKTTDHASDPYVFAILRTDRPDPSAGRCTPVPVPDTYARDAPPPTVTFIGNQPPDAIVIEDGTARIRVLHPSFALASELSDPRPLPATSLASPFQDAATAPPTSP